MTSLLRLTKQRSVAVERPLVATFNRAESTGAARMRLRAARIALQIAARSATFVANLMMAGCGACCTLR
jgi:hypothetical protein